MKRYFLAVVLLVLLVAASGLLLRVSAAVPGTVAGRLTQFGPHADRRWSPYFKNAALTYPPVRVALVGLKGEKRLEIYAAGATGAYRFVRSMPVLAASGGPGPKLREGDMQVPEGSYRIESLNPNSSYHLSLRVGYPNEFDRAQGRSDGRTQLGGDIMIHGKAVSAGCLAMGDEGAEDLFVLVARTGLKNVRAILVPVDFRRQKFVPPVGAPAWTSTLYEKLATELATYPLPKN